MKVLLFVGAGASVELGIPGMVEMAQAFRRHVSDSNLDLGSIQKILEEKTDFEEWFEEIERICGAIEPLRAIGQDSEVFDQANSIKAEIEWFVQHTCERMIPESATVQWAPVLRTARTHDLVIATTNYDRAIEHAASRSKMQVKDGFGDFGTREIAPWEGTAGNCEFGSSNDVKLLKLHGSTDWFQLASTGEPVKLRHPMPLFAGATLAIPKHNEHLAASLVLPTQEKKVIQSPFLEITQLFLESAKSCDIALFLGTSFRDEHIRHAAAQASKRCPTYTIGRSRSDKVPNDLKFIQQSASRFLISTLPAALATSDPEEVLEDSNQGTEASCDTGCEGILETVELLLDETKHQSERCKAIERLYTLEAALDMQTMNGVLSDSSRLVAKFALGLIPLSGRPDELLSIAKDRSDFVEDDDYAEELALLEKVLTSGR